MFLYSMIILLIIAAALSGFIVLKGSKWERLLGFSLVSAKINMMIIIFAWMSGRSYYIDIALVSVILSYIGVSVLAEFLVARIVKNRKGVKA